VLKSLPLRSLIAAAGFENSVSTYGSGKLPDNELRELAISNPNSFIRVVKPQFLDDTILPGTSEFLEASSSHLMTLIQNNVLQSLPNGVFLYSQFQPQTQQLLMGWVVGITADSYFTGYIKKHENTLEGKENRLVDHLEALDSMAEPVLLANKFNEELIELMSAKYSENPLISVTDNYGFIHQLRGEFDEVIYNHILSLIDNIGSLYIADGHHRFAAASKYLKKHNWSFSKGVMSLVMNQEDLSIKSFYRLVKYSEPIDFESEISKLGIEYSKCELSDTENCNLNSGEIIAITGKGDYKLNLSTHLSSQHNAVDELEVTQLENQILGPLFKLYDSKTDGRISFLRGDLPIYKIKEKLKKDEVDFVFVLPANTFSQVMNVADQQLTMPPKSTWIEPKLMTGFIIQQF